MRNVHSLKMWPAKVRPQGEVRQQRQESARHSSGAAAAGASGSFPLVNCFSRGTAARTTAHVACPNFHHTNLQSCLMSSYLRLKGKLQYAAPIKSKPGHADPNRSRPCDEGMAAVTGRHLHFALFLHNATAEATVAVLLFGRLRSRERSQLPCQCSPVSSSVPPAGRLQFC